MFYLNRLSHSLTCIFPRRFISYIMKVLNVAEKNDAAKGIADILSNGCYSRREGISCYNKNYEFKYKLHGEEVHMIMTSVSGHLLNYQFPPNYKAWHNIDPLVLFDAPIEKSVIKDGEPVKQNLQREIRGCQKLIIWTDCDREGENIGVEIIDVCRQAKKNFEVFRARFSEITQTTIHRSISQLTVPDYHVSSAVDARQELDLRIGAAFTRFQTLRLQRVFPRALSDQLISYGSCQFPTLGFVVERFREVDRFIPEPFWRIVVTAERNGKSADFQWTRGRLFDQDCCQGYYEQLMEAPQGKVIEVTKRPKSKWRPVALATVEFEKLASRKLRINAKTAMQIAERLYTRGFISYPRTETNMFPANFDLISFVRHQTEDPRWADFANRILQQGASPRNGRATDKAHPPIHPLKPGTGLSGDEARLYELITRHFLACLSADAQGAETLVRLQIGGGCTAASGGTTADHHPQQLATPSGEVFEARGLVILAANYLEVYVYDRWAERDMPDFQLGETVVPTDIQMLTGQTSAPALLTEADLISLMERHGIGTDATHADHIETIKSRLYVGLEQAKFLVPGQLGMGLVEGYDSMGLEMSKPHLRSELEADLKRICEGEKSKEDVLRHHLEKYKRLFSAAVSQAIQLDRSLAVRLEQDAADVSSNIDRQVAADGFPQHVAYCPSCSRSVVLRQRRPPVVQQQQNGASAPGRSAETSSSNSSTASWYLSCTGYPECRFAVWLPDSIVSVRPERRTDEQQQLSPVHCSQCQGAGASMEPPVRLAIRLRLGVRLPGGYVQAAANDEYSTCLFCDTDLRQALGIRTSHPAGDSNRSLISSPTTPPGTASQRRSTSSTVQRSPPPPPAHYSAGAGSSSSSPAAALPLQANHNNSGLAFCPGENEPIVVCSCGVQAVVLTVKKAGPNQGRLFYRCGGGPTGTNCDFFQWKSSPPVAADAPSGPMASSTQMQTNTTQLLSAYTRPVASADARRRYWLTGSAQSSADNPVTASFWPASRTTSSGLGSSTGDASDAVNSPGSVLCRCGEPAKLLRVTRPTANQGREFYACPNGRPVSASDGGAPTPSGCNFFQWADTNVNSAGASSSTPTSGWQSASSRWTGSRGRRERGGANGGSISALSSGVQVGHVPMWPPPASTGLLAGSDRQRPRRTGRSRTNQSTVRRCGLCGEPGHTRNRCPQVG